MLDLESGTSQMVKSISPITIAMTQKVGCQWV